MRFFLLKPTVILYFTQESKRFFPFEKIIKENLGISEPKNLTEEEKTLAKNIANEIGVAMDYNKRACRVGNAVNIEL